MTSMTSAEPSATQRLLLEPTSPFVERPAISVVLPAESRERTPSLLADLLRSPSQIVERLLAPQSLEALVLGAAGIIAVGIAGFAAVSMAQHGLWQAVRSAGLGVLSVLLALAAALGPVYGTGVLIAARIPMARLAGVFLSATATGALLLAASAPVPYVLMRFDPEWAGPLSSVVAFGLFGVATGSRMYTLLRMLAERVSLDPLTPDERFRVGILIRMAFAFVAFTTALSFWSFDAFIFGG